MSKERRFVCRLLLTASLTLTLATSWAGPLTCPDGVGLCVWEPEAGWRPVWKVRDVVVNSYWTASDGSVVVLAKGHQDPGRIYVLSPEYGMILVRELENSLPLAAVTTETPFGALLICQATPEISVCDTYLDPSSPNTLLREPSFPVGCLYPRFLPGGSAACVELSPRVRVFVRRAAGSTFEPVYELPETSSLVDIRPYSNGLLVATTDSLHFWKPGSTPTRIDAAPTSWIVIRDGVPFLAINSYDDREQEWSFAVATLRADFSIDTFWSSDELVPRGLTELGPNTYVLDAWSHGKRDLFRVTVDRESLATERVWSDRNRKLWQ